VTWIESLQLAWAGLVKYGPVLAEFIRFLEAKKTAEAQAAAATDFERGFRAFTQTKETKALQDAIYQHCTADAGCVLPPEV
jgi:hypothetical protein